MKRSLSALLTVFSFLSCISLQAQKLGVEGGVNYSDMAKIGKEPMDIDFKARTLFQVGLWGEWPLGNDWGLRPSLLYIRRGGQHQPSSVPATAVNINYDYLDIPLQVYVNQGAIQFSLGGAVGLPIDYALYDVQRNEQIEHSIVDEFWGTKANLSVIGGISFRWQHFQLSAQYQHALTPTLSDLNLTDVNGELIETQKGGHHQNILFSLAYTLWEK